MRALALSAAAAALLAAAPAQAAPLDLKCAMDLAIVGTGLFPNEQQTMSLTVTYHLETGGPDVPATGTYEGEDGRTGPLFDVHVTAARVTFCMVSGCRRETPQFTHVAQPITIERKTGAYASHVTNTYPDGAEGVTTGVGVCTPVTAAAATT